MATEYTGEVLPFTEYTGEVLPLESSTEKQSAPQQGIGSRIMQGAVQYGLRPLNELAGAFIDPALQVATGAIAKPVSEIAGLSAIGQEAVLNQGEDPEAFKKYVAEQLTYQPRTKSGQFVSENILAPIGRAFEYGAEQIGSGVESLTGNRAAGSGAKETAMQAIGFLGAKTIPKTIARSEKQAALSSARNEARAYGENIGLIAPPEGGGVRRTIYSTGRAADAVSLRNQQKATSAIAKDVGLPENVPITKDVISERRAILNKSYDEFANAFPSGVRISNAFTNKMKARLADVQNKLSAERETFKELEGVPDVLQEQINKAGGVRDAQGMIDSISALRAKADSAFMAGNKKSANIYRDIADGYEAAMSEQLKSSGNVNLYSQFENARRQHAKLHFVEQVVDPVSGLVDFNQLRSKSGSNLAKEKYLSGNTKVIADFARQFKTATKQLTPDQVATLGKWEIAVPLTATAGALGAGAGAGMMMGSPLLGAAMTAVPAAIGTAAPMLGQAGLLRRTPSYTPTKRVAGMGLMAASPYLPNEEQ